MWLLDKFLQKIIKVGRLVITDYDGKVYEYGPGNVESMEHGQPMHVRLTNRKASAHIARYPAVAAWVARVRGQPVIALDEGPLINFCRPAVDPLFRSVGACYGSGAISVGPIRRKHNVPFPGNVVALENGK